MSKSACGILVIAIGLYCVEVPFTKDRKDYKVDWSHDTSHIRIHIEHVYIIEHLKKYILL